MKWNNYNKYEMRSRVAKIPNFPINMYTIPAQMPWPTKSDLKMTVLQAGGNNARAAI